MVFRLEYLHLTLAYSKGQDHGHAHFDNEYLANGDNWDKLLPQLLCRMSAFD